MAGRRRAPACAGPRGRAAPRRGAAGCARRGTGNAMSFHRCALPLLVAGALAVAAPLAPASADVVSEWNEAAASVPAPDGSIVQLRALATAHAAAFDAVNAFEKRYAFYLSEFQAPAGALPEAAAATAIHGVLAGLVPDNRVSCGSRDQAQASSTSRRSRRSRSRPRRSDRRQDGRWRAAVGRHPLPQRQRARPRARPRHRRPGGGHRHAPAPAAGVRGRDLRDLRYSHIQGRRRAPPTSPRSRSEWRGGPTRAKPERGRGVLPRGASSTIRRRCRWVLRPNRRIILVGL